MPFYKIIPFGFCLMVLFSGHTSRSGSISQLPVLICLFHYMFFVFIHKAVSDLENDRKCHRFMIISDTM